MSTYNINELRGEIQGIRQRIENLRSTLKEYFVEKSDVIDLMVICTVAQEPLLLVGKPGTAKSDLIVKFCQALNLDEDEYFEYMLTKFTEPSEIIGPIDISELKEGKYLRKVGGKLPEANIAFLDEIFNSNSAILNTLLTVINERKYYQDGQPVPVDLLMLFAATNDIPEFAELAALRDRFVLKIRSSPVSDQLFDDLIEKGLRNDSFKAANQKPWKGISSLEDFRKMKAYMDHQFLEIVRNQDGQFKDPQFPVEVYTLFKRILKTLVKEDRLDVSDRKAIKLYKLIRTRAFLFHGGVVRKQDLQLLRYIADRLKDFDTVSEKVDSLLRLD